MVAIFYSYNSDLFLSIYCSIIILKPIVDMEKKLKYNILTNNLKSYYGSI